MTVQTAAEFLAKVGEDQDLAAQLENINTAEEIINFAQSQGYEFSPNDVAELQSVMETDELSEDQLEAVAGGGWFSTTVSVGKFLYENRGMVEEGLTYLQNKAHKKWGW